MSKYIHKSHNVSVLMYHIICPAKYRKVIFDNKIEKKLKDICLKIVLRYEIEFLEIGVDKDHMHFLVQAVPTYSPKKVAQTIKSIMARERFKRVPEVKKVLWGGELWLQRLLFYVELFIDKFVLRVTSTLLVFRVVSFLIKEKIIMP